MSDHFSPFPSCFRPSNPTPSTATSTATDQHSLAVAPPSFSGNPNLTTSLYHTEIGYFTLTWSRNLLGRSLYLHLHLDNYNNNLSPSSLSDSFSLSTASFHLHIKPFIFWRKHGSKRLNTNHTTTTKNKTIQVFWDLTRAKFGPGPEPQSGFYIAVVIDGELTLLVGDSAKEAYTRTKAAKPKRAQTLVLRREHVFGNKVYTTKARFGGKTRDISIECNVGDDSRLFFSVDSKRVLQIKHLKWKFRGNERIEVDGVHLHVSWDVYNWLFDHDLTDGHAVFMFRFENQLGFNEGEEQEEDNIEVSGTHNVNDKNGMVLCGFGMNGYERKKMKKSMMKTRSSSSSSMSSGSSGSSSILEWASMEEKELEGPSGFSLLVYAWKS